MSSSIPAGHAIAFFQKIAKIKKTVTQILPVIDVIGTIQTGPHQTDQRLSTTGR